MLWVKFKFWIFCETFWILLVQQREKRAATRLERAASTNRADSMHRGIAEKSFKTTRFWPENPKIQHSVALRMVRCCCGAHSHMVSCSEVRAASFYVELLRLVPACLSARLSLHPHPPAHLPMDQPSSLGVHHLLLYKVQPPCYCCTRSPLRSSQPRRTPPCTKGKEAFLAHIGSGERSPVANL